MESINNNLPSNKTFGVFFGVLFMLAGTYFLIHGGRLYGGVGILCSVILFTLAYVFPKVLMPANRAWHLFGKLLGKLINPLVLGFVFFIIISPLAIVLRLSGRDELRLKRVDMPTYWKERSTKTFDPDSFKNQF
ncbi:MAG: hypothetical protein ACJAS1_002597 [Oleiphilaceae bacterium]|jgi:ABC-type Mn2+/Zn2+ transport system permease subunit